MNNTKKPYKKIEETPIYGLSHDFVLEVYKITASFPKEELFGLTSQLRRSASSVPANISEGFYRNSNRELSQFLFVARGSLGESLYQLKLAKDLHYLSPELFLRIELMGHEVGKQLNAWIGSIKRRSL